MPEETKTEEKKVETIKFSDSKNTVTVEAIKNIPLALIVRGDPVLERDPKVQRAGRVERGTKITVPKKVADLLKSVKYVK